MLLRLPFIFFIKLCESVENNTAPTITGEHPTNINNIGTIFLHINSMLNTFTPIQNPMLYLDVNHCANAIQYSGHECPYYLNPRPIFEA